MTCQGEQAGLSLAPGFLLCWMADPPRGQAKWFRRLSSFKEEVQPSPKYSQRQNSRPSAVSSCPLSGPSCYASLSQRWSISSSHPLRTRCPPFLGQATHRTTVYQARKAPETSWLSSHLTSEKNQDPERCRVCQAYCLLVREKAGDLALWSLDIGPASAFWENGRRAEASLDLLCWD